MFSICREFLSNRRQRVIVDGATSEWIPMVSGVPEGSVFRPLLFTLYNSETFELVENKLYAYTDDSTASQQTYLLLLLPEINRDLARN